jgi:hypothetical protein
MALFPGTGYAPVISTGSPAMALFPGTGYAPVRA